MYNRWNKFLCLCCSYFVPAKRQASIFAFFGTDLTFRLEVEEEGSLFWCQMFAHPSKKNNLSLPNYYCEKQRLLQTQRINRFAQWRLCMCLSRLLTAAVLFLQCWNTPSRRLAGLTPVVALGFGVAWKKWLFFCLALFLCSQTVTLKVDTVRHYPWAHR